jgi:CRISPR-associated protein Cas5
MKLNIDFLLEPPNLTRNVLLTILPLAPLSMVNSMPGSYYKTEHIPDKFMLCGLFENILNLHLSENDRNAIRKKIKGHYKKKYKIDYHLEASNVGYKPISNHLFEIELPIAKPDLKFYEDLWTQHLIGSDERHLKGVVNYDWRVEKDMLGLKERNNSKEKNLYFTNNRKYFPLYYRSPQKREFLIAKGYFSLKLKMTPSFFDVLEQVIENNNIGYLGTSEGWVDVAIGEFK